MKNIISGLLMIFAFSSYQAQINIIESFPTTTTPAGWNLGGSSLSTTSSCATASWRGNVYDAVPRILTTPGQVATNGDLTISFDYKIVNWSAATVATNPYNGTITTEISVDNGTTWTVIAGVINNSNHITANTCANVSYVVPAASIPVGNTVRVRWNCVWGTSGDYYVYIDNVSITQPAVVPPNCTAITAPANGSTTVTAASAVLTWAAATGAPSGYKINVGTTPGGTDVLNMFDAGNVLTYAISGLIDGTSYYATVIPYNLIGDAVGPCTEINFTTCSPNSIPYFQGFESGFAQGTAIGGCLTQASITGTGVWNANNTLTDYNRTPRTGGWNAYLQWSNEDWLFIPVALTGGTSYTFETYARQDGATAANSNITVSYGTANTGAAMTNSIVASTGIINGGYQLITGTFTPATSGTYYVGIKGFMNGTPFYISMDDISIYETPDCVQPINLNAVAVTNNSASLIWADAVGTLWDVEYGISGFTPGSGTLVSGHTNDTLAISSLTTSTAYSFYVRTDCGASESAWSGPYTFTTQCDPYTIPYFEGFESGYVHNTTVAGCLSQASVTEAQTWTANNTFTDYNRTPRTGGWNAFLRYGNEDWLFIPVVLTGGTNYTFESYARQDGATAANSNMTVRFGSANTAAAMTNAIVPSTGIINGAYQLITGTFTPTISGTYYIGIKGFMNSSPWYISLDDIAIYETPAPSITSFTSTVACGLSTVLTINGTELANATVEIGGTPISLSTNNDTLIVATISSALSGAIEVTTAGGTAVSVTNFDFAVAPAFAISGSSATFCAGDTSDLVTITAGAGDYTSYVWTPSTEITGNETLGWYFHPSTSTNYSLVASNVAGCTNTAMYNVTVNQNASINSITSSESSICVGEGVDLNVVANSNAFVQTIEDFGFEDPTLPATWTITNAGTGNIWTSATNAAHSGTRSMQYQYNSTNDADAWAITSPYSLAAGQEVTLSFWYKIEGATFPEKLKVTSGTDATVASQTNVLWDNNGGTQLTNTTWQQATINFTAPSAGSYNFGFNCYSDADMFRLYVDDVQITYPQTETPTYSWTSNPAGFTSAVQNPTGVEPTVSTDYMVEVSNAAGCSVTDTVSVVVNTPSASNFNVTECTSYTWAQNGTEYFTSGSFNDTIMNAAGCDSVVTLNLTIIQPTTSSVSVTNCGPYTWAQNGETYAMSGSFNDTIMNAAMCDSVITLNLTINSPTASTVNVTNCGPYTWAQNGETYAMSGSFNDTIMNAAMCDSVVTLVLTINSPSASTVNVTNCGPYTWSQNGETYAMSGSFNDTIMNAAMCDSVVTLVLTINSPSASTVNVTTCDPSYTWTQNGATYMTSGMYYDTVANASGCDSVITLNLTINSITATATDNGNATITASTGTSYVWINCATNLPIAGATAQTFAPTVNGSYAVVVTNAAGCSDTSACVTIANVGIKELVDHSLNVYPNPTNGNVTIEFSAAVAKVEVIDAQGKSLQTQSVSSGDIISLENYERGVYFLKINSENGSAIQRVVKN